MYGFQKMNSKRGEQRTQRDINSVSREDWSEITYDRDDCHKSEMDVLNLTSTVLYTSSSVNP